MTDAVHDHATLSAEADLQLDLVPVRVLPYAAAGRDGLVAHGEAVEPRRRRGQLGIGVAVGGDRLPVRDALLGLDDHRAPSHHFGCAHRRPPCGNPSPCRDHTPRRPRNPTCRPVIRRTVWSDKDTEILSRWAQLTPKLALRLWTIAGPALALLVQKPVPCSG